MALVKDNQATKLVLYVVTGMKGNGSALTKQYSFSTVNPAITDADLYDICGKLAALQTHEVSKISRVDSSNLVDEVCRSPRP